MAEFIHNDLVFDITDSGLATLVQCRSSKTSVMVPAVVNHCGRVCRVVAVADSAFKKSQCIEVNVAEGVKSIGPECFAKSSLKKLFLPKSVMSVGDLAFDECGSLSVIRCAAKNPPEFQMAGFLNKSDVEVVVPVGSSKLYMASDGWGEFGRFSESDEVMNQTAADCGSDVMSLVASLSERVSALERRLAEFEERMSHNE